MKPNRKTGPYQTEPRLPIKQAKNISIKCNFHYVLSSFVLLTSGRHLCHNVSGCFCFRYYIFTRSFEHVISDSTFIRIICNLLRGGGQTRQVTYDMLKVISYLTLPNQTKGFEAK